MYYFFSIIFSSFLVPFDSYSVSLLKQICLFATMIILFLRFIVYLFLSMPSLVCHYSGLYCGGVSPGPGGWRGPLVGIDQWLGARQGTCGRARREAGQGEGRVRRGTWGEGQTSGGVIRRGVVLGISQIELHYTANTPSGFLGSYLVGPVTANTQWHGDELQAIYYAVYLPYIF